MSVDSESLTRKSRSDPKLDARGWRRVKAPSPAAAIVGAKKTAVDPQNVLNQAERSGRALKGSPCNFDGIRVPFGSVSTYAQGRQLRTHTDTLST